MATKFKTGDIVRLKSGGPEMTVKEFRDRPQLRDYTCQWFAGKKLESGHFEEDSLEFVTAE